MAIVVRFCYKFIHNLLFTFVTIVCNNACTVYSEVAHSRNKKI